MQQRYRIPGRYLDLIWPHQPREHAPPRYRRACRYRAFIPEPLAALQLTLPAEVAGSVSEAEAAIQVLNAEAQPGLIPIARLLLRSESIASSKVEGMQLDVRQLARAEARAETGGKASGTAMEILANIDAMELAVHDAATVSKFRTDQIRAIHRRLMEKAPNQQRAGIIRSEQNWIGGNDYNPCGAEFVPPPVEHVEPLLRDLCKAVNDDRLPPVVQAALVHAQFETIHPFDDGNGRAGRALIHVVLRRRGTAPQYVPPVSIVLARNRKAYIEGLMGFRANRVTEWIRYFAEAAARSATLAKTYLGEVRRLIEGWRAKLRAGAEPRADAAAWAIIDVLPGHPVITGPVAAALTGRARAAVYQGLSQLEDAGVLIPLSRSQRNQAWEAAGLLDLIAGLEAGELPAMPIYGPGSAPTKHEPAAFRQR